MSDLDSIASVTVSTTGAGLSRQGFGTIALVVNDGVLSAPTVDTYRSSSAVATAEGEDSPVHRMAVAAFSQSPRPKRVKVIKTGLAIAQSLKCTVAAATSGIVTTIKLYRPDGTTASYSYTQAGADTTTDIAAALVTAINAGEAGSPASNSGAILTLANNTDGEVFFIDLVANLGTFLDNTADPGIAAKLTLARAIDDDWYGVALDCNSAACVEAVAAWVETNDKFFCYATADSIELSASALASTLKTAAYTKTFGSYHSLPKQYQAVAWMAARLRDLADGAVNWSYATLAGITADTLNDTQKAYLDTQRLSFYVTITNRNIMHGTDADYPGGAKVASGEWIDIIHGNDWLRVRTQEDIVSLIINAGRIPYTQAGLNAIGAAIEARMRLAESVGFLAAGSTQVFVPDIADASDADKRARIANDFEATATYAGAINYAGITLSLGY